MESGLEPVIETRKITKSFGHIHALRGASFRAYPGEVLALIGDNGAGKSTQANVIAGVHASDSGELLRRGRKVEVGAVRQAVRSGSIWCTRISPRHQTSPLPGTSSSAVSCSSRA